MLLVCFSGGLPLPYLILYGVSCMSTPGDLPMKSLTNLISILFALGHAHVFCQIQWPTYGSIPYIALSATFGVNS